MEEKLGLLQQVTALISDDPIVQMVLAVLLAAGTMSVVIAIVFAVLRPALLRLRKALPVSVADEVWRMLLRLLRWGVAIALAAIPGHPVAALPWLAVLGIALVAAEGAESVWGWFKSLARLAGARVTSLVRPQGA